MHYLVIAYDHPGAEGRRRRARAREAHLAQAASMKQVKAVFGTAILGDDGDMIGSMLVMAADSREDLDAWLRVEPYVVDDVWREVRVHRCQVGPPFLPTGGRTLQ
ncbi:YciI family protein [Streptomyces sp. YGL11-2]|uniref:YciI family protein n=1 Tax=Streptomyces sp. YGL11-2 TaxID=3414028 RepID=UPI003CF37339